MNTYEIVDLDSLYVGTVNIDSYGALRIRECPYRSKDVKGKVAIFYDRNYADPYRAIRARSRNYCSSSSSIYVSKEVKTARDIFRNSGYKIVLDRDKADKIVVPTPASENCLTFKTDLAIKAGGKVILYSLHKDVDDFHYDSILAMVKRRFGDDTVPIFDKIQREYICTLIRNYPIYREILDDDYTKLYGKLCLETELTIDYPVKISPETLAMWARADNEGMLSKSICMSDWKDYPFTVLALLQCYHSAIYHFGGNNMRLVAEQVGLPTDGRYRTHDDVLNNRIVQPKDWNMLQDWLMYELNLDERGGYTRFEKLNDLPLVLRNFVRQRVVVAPTRIDTPLLSGNIVSMNNN